MAHLRSVYQQMGASLVQEMLDYPATLASAKEPRAAHLGKPMLLFDSVGVAVSFVPVGKHPYTYHHLRTDLYGMALRSAVKIDTCYTACTGHITLGRFISTKTFNLESKEATQKRFEAWVDTIQSINQELRESYWTPEWSWVIGEEKGLEMQIGPCFSISVPAWTSVRQYGVFELMCGLRDGTICTEECTARFKHSSLHDAFYNDNVDVVTIHASLDESAPEAGDLQGLSARLKLAFRRNRELRMVFYSDKVIIVLLILEPVAR
ncbi:hypothetical protein PRK78_004634 [Emydomyces testavorans]|uniref:Uncharacterized protein n=1 Tax=Emydomyces testavorans TaxID=2070801 RepID=A0AAF0DLV6_9EURO|nr:hypothetical protein PRK78_004634 [Emydomyces testavorans]